MIRKSELAVLALALAALSGTAAMAEAGAAASDAQGAAVAASATDPESKAIFEANCSSCHELSDATSKAKDLAGWTETVAKMVSYGAPVAYEDQQRIVAYLAATYPASAS